MGGESKHVTVGNTVKASFHEELPSGAVMAASAFGPDGVLLDYASAEVSAEVSLDLNLDGASVVRIYVMKSREDPAPLMPETELTLK